MACRTTLYGCWGCGLSWDHLRFEPLAYDAADAGYYCERCDVYSKKGTLMDFVAWLLTKQGKRDTPVGDLARDVRGDRCLPVTDRTPEAVLNHIMTQHHACQGARDALKQAEREWRRAEQP